MKVSLSWLQEYVSLEGITPDELASTLTLRSQEIEAVYPLIEADKLLIGEVLSVKKNEKADKLSVCDVNTGKKTLQIVCGAPNVKKGQKVVVALPGAKLAGGLKIEKTTLRGVESNGMICSLTELGLDYKYHHEDGIHVLADTAPVGEDAIEYLAFNDTVVELDLTPNRSDLLSMHGVAYDVAAIYDRNLKLPTPEIITANQDNAFTIETQTDKCPSYYARILDNVTIAPSPRWLQARLIAAGIRPINNVVDITNYVMLETGQPLHAFDLDKLSANRVLVREAKQGETFITLDEDKRTLEEGDVLITDGEKPIALGGVMGGLDTEVGDATVSLLLESATFDPRQIRRTSSRLDLRSESSIRFERGVDPEKTPYALDRACAFLATYAKASIRNGVRYFDHHKTEKRIIPIALEKVNNVLGAQYTKEDIKSVFDRLNFSYEEKEGRFLVEAPSRRVDIETYQDLIEEIGRLKDFNELPDTLPSTVSIGSLSAYQRFKRDIRKTLSALGLSEAITYCLREKERINDLTRENESPVELSKPLSKAHHALVLSPLTGLFDVVAYNKARKQESVHVFEIGKRYRKNEEPERLGIAMHGPFHPRHWQKTPPTNFFTLKGVVEALQKGLRLPRLSYEKATLENYHPHQSAVVKAGDTTVGHIGKVHPEYAEGYDVEDVYLAELAIDKLFEMRQKAPTYRAVSKYPGISRDLALVVDEDLAAGELQKTVERTLEDKLKESRVFDVYTGKNIEEGKKSLAIRLVFEAREETLQSKEIDCEIDRVIKALKETHNARLR